MCKHVSQRQLQNYKEKVLLTWLDELLAGNKVALTSLIILVFTISISRVEYDYEP